MEIGWKTGVEIELLAPPGRTRLDLAQAIARDCGGTVRCVLHPDTEPSRVAGKPLFANLTPGFEVLDATGALVARCVDDLTLQADLDKSAPPKPGWWRVVGDDERILRLLAPRIDAALPLPEALAALPDWCHGQLEACSGGMWRLSDGLAAPLAIAAPLPGERERPCELISAPLSSDHAARIDVLLGQARALDFRLPVEGALHLHFDAGPLCHAAVIANLVQLLTSLGPALKQLCRTPGTFRRVGSWSPALIAAVQAPDFRDLDWPTACARLRATEPSKYCDFNLRNIAYARADRHTFEVRILPATLDTAQVLAALALFESVLRHCLGSADALPDAVATLIQGLPEPARGVWQRSVP